MFGHDQPGNGDDTAEWCVQRTDSAGAALGRRGRSLRSILARFDGHGTGSHFVTQRLSHPGIQRPGDPVDPVTLFYNELQMSTYVADKRLQWARGVPVFIADWRLHASGK